MFAHEKPEHTVVHTFDQFVLRCLLIIANRQL